jgi:hypothetical protein
VAVEETMPIHDWTRVEPGICHDFHHEWISALKRTLNDEILPDDYYALVEQIAGRLGPDILTPGRSGRVPSRPAVGDEAIGGRGKTAIELERRPPSATFVDEVVSRLRLKRSRVAIRHVSDDRVVSFVEIVSPGNKSSARGIRLFVGKAIELIEAGIHLLLLDLFPPGPCDPQGIHGVVWRRLHGREFRLPVESPLTLASYLAGEKCRAYVEPTSVGCELPDMPLFLEPDQSVVVPLASTYNQAFAGVPRHYRERLASSNF